MKMNFKCQMSFKKLSIGNLIFENTYKCQEKMALCGRNEWRKFGNYLPVTQSDVNLWISYFFDDITTFLGP